MNFRAEANTAAFIHRVGVDEYVRYCKAHGEQVSDGHIRSFCALGSWAHCGLQSVRMPHTYAAALMATSPAGISLRLPWPTFEIRIPGGLLNTEQYGEPQSVLVTSNCVGASLYMRIACSGGGFYAHALEGPLDSLCDEGIEECVLEESGFPPYGTDTQRVGLLLRRLVANVCHDIAAHHTAVASAAPSSLRLDHHGVALPRGFAIGEPLKLDCRQSIRDYVAGERSRSPKCITLVRGHWRNQVHGPRNTLRHLIWIAPFYRGPDGAPLLVRATHIGGVS